MVQPAQSPDFNIWDLGLFRSLASRVHRIHRTNRKGGAKQLWASLQQIWADYDRETLEKIHVCHQLMCKQAIAQNGGNFFECPHATDAEKLALLPPPTV